MVQVYGASNCFVEITGSKHEEWVECFELDVRIHFTDGTIIRIGYLRCRIGVWWIEIERQGDAPQSLSSCYDEELEVYSDVFSIDAEIKCYYVIRQKYHKRHKQTALLHWAGREENR